MEGTWLGVRMRRDWSWISGLGVVTLTHRTHYTDHLPSELRSEFSIIRRFQKVIREGENSKLDVWGFLREMLVSQSCLTL